MMNSTIPEIQEALGTWLASYGFFLSRAESGGSNSYGPGIIYYQIEHFSASILSIVFLIVLVALLNKINIKKNVIQWAALLPSTVTKTLIFLTTIYTMKMFRKLGKLSRSFDDREDEDDQLLSKRKPILSRQLTSIGRFCVQSETALNPSLETFFMAFVHPKTEPLTVPGVEELWRERVISKHERFRSRVSKIDNRFFELIPEDEEVDTILPKIHPQTRKSMQKLIERKLTAKMDVTDHLCEIDLSTGSLGSSGSIIHIEPYKAASSNEEYVESLAVIRVHHALCDGVSLSVAMGDSVDEHEKLKSLLKAELSKRHENHKRNSLATKMFQKFQLIYFYIIGSIIALTMQAWMLIVTIDPFYQVIKKSTIPEGKRSASWEDGPSVEEAKNVAKALGGKGSTINDLFVACASAAVIRQLQEHQHHARNKESAAAKHTRRFRIPSSINVVVPVHLNGGMLLPGESIGNKIGAFVAKLPGDVQGMDSYERFKRVTSSLKACKLSPAPLISWSMARFCSNYLPETVAQTALMKGNAKAAFVLSNVRGFPMEVHWNGRLVKSMTAFLPLPPSVPIGLVLSSYAGRLTLTVNADKRAVPDADRFLQWTFEEYDRLKSIASGVNSSNIKMKKMKGKKVV